jgi:hypothetical protein
VNMVGLQEAVKGLRHWPLKGPKLPVLAVRFDGCRREHVGDGMRVNP